MANPGRRQKIAVIGAGAAGITAACLLQEAHDVTLYERSAVLGGHAHSFRIDNGIESPFEVDTAFVVFNSGSYPLFLELLAWFGLTDRIRPTEMSFSYTDPSLGLCYAVNRGLVGLFASPGNWRRPLLYRLLPELMRFRRDAARDLAGGRDATRDLAGRDWSALTLSQYLERGGYSRAFAENFLYPTAMAVWSVPAGRVRDFPAVSFLCFLENHRYLGGARGRWLTLSGGCRQYVRAFQESFAGRVLVGQEVVAVCRGGLASGSGAGSGLGLGAGSDSGSSLGSGCAPASNGGATVRTRDGGVETYDKVILATHADQALRLLENPSALERRLLGAWTYHRSPTVLHEDASLMPANRRLWASWNIVSDSRPPESTRSQGLTRDQITYHLNRVQGLTSRRDYFVTLGEVAIAENRVLARFDYEHPVFDFSAVTAQRELPSLNGAFGSPDSPDSSAVYFCGSYFGFGFHEDAVRSAVEVARLLGAPGTENAGAGALARAQGEAALV